MGAEVCHFYTTSVAGGHPVVAGEGISGIPDAETPGGLGDVEPGAERVAVPVPRGAEAQGGRNGGREASGAEPAVADGAHAGGGRAIAGDDGGDGQADGGIDVWLGAQGDGVRAAEDQGRGFREPLYRGAGGQGRQGPPGAASEEGGPCSQRANRSGEGAMDQGSGAGRGGSFFAGGAFGEIHSRGHGMGMVLAVSCGRTFDGSLDKENPSASHGGKRRAATGAEMRSSCGTHKAGDAAHAEAFVCHASPGVRGGHTDGTRVARAQRRLDDDDLHARSGTPRDGGGFTAGSITSRCSGIS